jgi:translation initiation factor 4G
MKRRYLGTIRFIGELFMMSMLTVRIMHECVERLLSGYKKTKDEDRLECLCKLLATIGAKMDEPQALAGATKSSSSYPDHQVKIYRWTIFF